MEKKLEKFYNSSNDIWGFPQLYKRVKFYPIKLADVETQTLFYKIFQVPKNYISEKEIIKMSYLKYLIYFIGQITPKEDGRITVEDKLIDFFQRIAKTDRVRFYYSFMNNDQSDPVNNLMIEFSIGDVRFNERDFDIIRGIILKQNGLSIEYIEEFDPELEEKLEYVDSDLKDITLEDQVMAFVTMNNLSIKDIEDYTLYQFKKHFIRSHLLLDYQIYSPLEISGQIKSKSGEKIVRHYMEHMYDRKRYDSILIPKEKLLMSVPGMPDEKSGNVMPHDPV